MKTKELAKEFANNLESIKDIDCPRDVINPGLWFGFIKGYEAASNEITAVQLKADNILGLINQIRIRDQEIDNLKLEIELVKNDIYELQFNYDGE